jgi:hypothetical protein
MKILQLTLQQIWTRLHYTLNTDVEDSFSNITFKWLCWYVNFGTWKVWLLFEHEKTKLWNKWHFVDNKDYTACYKYAINFPVV